MEESAIPCCLCGGIRFIKVYNAFDFDTGKIPFHLSRCDACGLVRTEPILDETHLGLFYPNEYYGAGDTKFTGFVEILTRYFQHIRGRRFVKLLAAENIAPSRRLRFLDVGCGRGSLLKSLSRLNCECHGVERAEFPTEETQETILFHRKELLEIGFGDNSFDAVILWHSLEHMMNPKVIVEEIARILRPGGIIAVAVPNFGSYQARLFRRHWFHLDLPRHTYHFDLSSLKQCLSDSGLHIFRTSTSSLEQNLYGFIQSLLNALFYFKRPNQFYTVLKSGRRLSLRLLGWIVLASLASPFALIEYVISDLLGKGATLIVYAKKQ